MNRSVIVIPYRPTDKHRRAAFDHVYAQATRTGLPVIVGDSGDQPFSIARTWNQLAKEAGDWDYLVRWGADFLLADHEQIHAAIALDAPYTLACDTTHRQTRREAEAGLVTFSGGNLFGGPNIVTRELWDLIGGFDERFKGWGHEDRAFVHGVHLFTGNRRRVIGGMCALWHPRPDNAYTAAKHHNLALWRDIEAITTKDGWFDYLERR